MTAVGEVDQGFQSAARQDRVKLGPHQSNWRQTSRTGLDWLPGVHALHEDLVLFALHHVVGEHGVEVRDGGGQDDAVSAELVIANLREKSCCYRGNCEQHSQTFPLVPDQRAAGSARSCIWIILPQRIKVINQAAPRGNKRAERKRSWGRRGGTLLKIPPDQRSENSPELLLNSLITMTT